MKGRHSTTRSAMLVPVFVSLAVPSAARADVEATWWNETNWVFEISHVPDLDQRRDFLPGNGSMYCVPTSSINWFAYFANHGVPAMSPGPGYWQSQTLYDEANWAIYLLGVDMSCSPTSGVNGGGTMTGLNDWLYGQPFTVTGVWDNQHWTPQVQDMAEAVFSGAYVIACVGWYQEMSGNLINRQGGHAMSLNYGVRLGEGMLVGWRDPGSDEGNLNYQSNFSTEIYSVETREKRPLAGAWYTRPMSKIVDYGSGYLDCYYAITPTIALSPQTNNLGLLILTPELLIGAHVPAVAQIPAPEGRVIVSEALHPDMRSYFVITAPPELVDPYKLWRVNAVTGEAERILPTLADPRQVMIGRRRGLYVMDGFELVYFEIDPPGGPQEIVRRSLPGMVNAMTYDDASDEVVLLSVPDHQLWEYPWHLDANPIVRDIPGNVPLSGEVSMAWNVEHDSVMVLSEASDSVYEMSINPFTGQVMATEIAHPSLVDPTGVAVGDGGRLFVCSQQQMIEFIKPAGGGWMPAPDPWFAGAQVGERAVVSQSRTNWDPDIHVGPAWENVFPEVFGEPNFDCDADVNSDGVVDVQDLLQVLSSWGPRHIPADINFDGAVDVQDLLMLLAAWGPCP